MSGPKQGKLAYTVEEAADLLSLSRANLYRLIDMQELGSITIGRSRRITARQLEEFVAKLEARSALPLSLDRFHHRMT
jgi:excisionase family DNA binding protein